MKKFGIHKRLLLAAILMIGATTVTLGTIGVKTIHQFVRTRFEERIQFLAKYLALNAELGILIDERATLRRLSSNMLAEKDVVRVVIFNDKRERLADIEKTPAVKNYSTIEIPVQLETSNSDVLAFPGDKPRALPDIEVIGSVLIYYTTEGIDQLLSVMKRRLIWLSVGLSFIAVLIFFFLSRSLVAPVTKIAMAARKYVSGDLKERPVPGNLPETRELTLAFNSMLDSIEWGNKALEEAYQEMIKQKTLAELGKFSMMVAHEFKNPLSIIKGSLNNLKKENMAILKENLMVQYIEEEIILLNRLIEDFLMFSKPLKPVFRGTDLNETLSSRMERFLLHAETIPINIDTQIPEEPCIANADRDLLIRVMDNLIKNALESSETESRINITAERIGGIWVMRVADHGSGISEENMEKIFEPFFTTRSKGSGLGLAFARQVIIAHNGTIHAENINSGGACFTVCLPVSDVVHKESVNA